MMDNSENQESIDAGEGTIVDHLNEVRQRCLFSLYSFLFFFLLTYWQADFFVSLILRPLKSIRPDLKLSALSVTEGFMTTLKVAIFVAITAVLPIIFHQVWKFIEPGLRKNEKIWFKILFLPMILAFSSGVCFCYFIVLPLSLNFLLGSLGSDFTPLFSYASYVDFTTIFLLLMGFVFELPVFLAFLDRTGIFPAEKVRSRRREGIILAFIIGALVSPPDVFSQISVAIPLIFLMEAGIWFSFVLRKFNKVVE